jgi:hypothetical protein
MEKVKTPKLELTDGERTSLRAHTIKLSGILAYAPDELAVLMGASEARAREVWALADFQRIPTIGIRFAEDLVFLGFGSVAELRGKDPAKLTDAFELKKGYRTDPCVEDQFRLAVFFADTGIASRKWWDFTRERKAYREAHGYPKSRPAQTWIEARG